MTTKMICENADKCKRNCRHNEPHNFTHMCMNLGHECDGECYKCVPVEEIIKYETTELMEAK